MSTRSLIGIYLHDSLVVSIYCHHDGYPSHVGSILFEKYNDRDKVSKLIEGGSISALHEDGSSVPYTSMGEPLIENMPTIDIDKKGYIYGGQRCGAEYLYLFSPVTKEWEMYDMGNKVWKPLKEVLEDEAHADQRTV